MDALLSWARWEFSRRVELTLGLRLIILDRSVKFLALTGGGVGLLIANGTGELTEFAQRVQAELNLRPGSHLWLRLVSYLLQHFGSLSSTAQTAIAIAAILYGLLEGVEAVGLALRRRWSEYLVLLATCAFIPLEIDELARHPTPLKGLAFAINLVIAAYLVWRKRLFLDHPAISGRACSGDSRTLTHPRTPARPL